DLNTKKTKKPGFSARKRIRFLYSSAAHDRTDQISSKGFVHIKNSRLSACFRVRNNFLFVLVVKRSGLKLFNLYNMHILKHFTFALSILFISVTAHGQGSVKIAKLKYGGGGDWYANKTALPNLIKFCNAELNTSIAPEEDVVEVSSKELYLYPYIYMTGHGNVVFSE